MVIENIIRKIWDEEYQLYLDECEKSRSIDEDCLFEICKKDVLALNEKPYKSKEHTLTIMETIGCQYQMRGNGISGCSFCNWDSKRIKELARLYVLKGKNEEKYAQIIRFSFTRIRGERCNPSLIEQLSVHDIFNKNQFPLCAYKDMFEDYSVYRKRPEWGIISARADQVTAERVLMWKKAFKRGLTIGIGIECGNNWIRNHFLNKNISNQQIKSAVEIIQSQGCKVCANILLGMPGLSEESGLAIFYDTCNFVVNELNVDYVLISPLINKEKTIGILCNENQRSISSDLLINAVVGLQERYSKQLNKVTFSPDNLDLMLKGKEGNELKMVQNLFSIIDNLGTVYTSLNGYYGIQEIMKYSKIIKLASLEEITQDMKRCIRTVAGKLGMNEIEVEKAFEEELSQMKIRGNYHGIS